VNLRRCAPVRHVAALVGAGIASIAALAGWYGVLVALGEAARGWSVLLAHAGHGWLAHTLLFYVLFVFVESRRGCVESVAQVQSLRGAAS
jgi:hypothetical protein